MKNKKKRKYGNQRTIGDGEQWEPETSGAGEPRHPCLWLVAA